MRPEGPGRRRAPPARERSIASSGTTGTSLPPAPAPVDAVARTALELRAACAEHDVDAPLVLALGLTRLPAGRHRAPWVVHVADRAVLACSGCRLFVRVGGGR